MKTLFIILARGGSKGLPGKNIKDLHGKPLIAYSIECGLTSKYCSRLIVSTDDEEIARTAENYGADVPFIRPAELASDTAGSVDAILHAIEFCESKGDDYPMLVLLEPTSPLRDTEDIDKAIEEFLIDPDALSSVSMTKTVSAHPNFLFTLDEHSHLSRYLDENNTIRRQELKPLYYTDGSFYIIYTTALKKWKTFYIDKYVKGFELPRWKSFEIDTEEDFIIIESLLTAKFAGKFDQIN